MTNTILPFQGDFGCLQNRKVVMNAKERSAWCTRAASNVKVTFCYSNLYMLCIFAVIYATPLPFSVLFFHALGFLLPSLFPLLSHSSLPRDLPLLHNRLALPLLVQGTLAFILVLLPVLDLAIPRTVCNCAAGAHEEFVATLGREGLADFAAEGTALQVLLCDLGDDWIATKT